MAESTKGLSEYDYGQVLQKAFNKEGTTLGVDGFLSGKIGRSVTKVITTTNVTDDTEVLTFAEDATTLFELTIVYTDGTREDFTSVTRTA